jgi:serine/threonine protein kinase
VLTTIAPEYALDSQLSPANDLYSLGCVLYAVHFGGKPPYINRGSIQSLRDNAEGPLVRRDWARGSSWDRASTELKGELLRMAVLTARSSSKATDSPCLVAAQPGLSSHSLILLVTRNLDFELSGPSYVRVKTERRKGYFSAWTGARPSWILGAATKGQGVAESTRRGALL